MTKVYSLATLSEEMGEFVSYAVRSFAEEKNLYFDLWHKDSPIWVITDLNWNESNIGPVVRKLTIGVFQVERSLEIIIVPDIYKIKGGKRTSMTSEERQKQTRTVTYKSFLRAVVRDVDNGVNEVLWPELEKAWSDLQKTQLKQ